MLVTDDQAGMRLDAYLARAAGVTRARAAELIAGGAVTVDGRAEDKSYRVHSGERVETTALERVRAAVAAPEIRVVFEDDHLLVADKPAGVVVHRAPGVHGGTLVDALEESGRPLAPRAGEDRPGIVHRLDRDVSGLLVVAKSDAVHRSLVDAMAARRVRREYIACVDGAPEVDTGKIDAPVGRNPRHRTKMAVTPDGRTAVTWFRVLERLAGTSLVEVRLETGRTHQIRTHLASIGHPILGDSTYGHDPGRARRAGLGRPFLHAFRLAFVHPVTGAELEFTSELPPDLRDALERLKRS